MNKNSKMRLVCIGNGMAGMRALEELLKIAPDLYDITVFGAEPHPNYNRILLSPVLAGEQTLKEIVLNDLDWYQSNNITLHLGKKITEINRIKRVVLADDGTEAEYDRLLLATGSNPILLPIPGMKLPGVLTYRDIADTEGMIAASSQYKNAVVIGGGLLGLEAANGLKLRGMNVTVIHLADWLMERQLDRTASQLLQTSLEKKGLQFRLSAQTEELVADESGRVAAVRLKGGETIAAELVVVAIGIRPNTELAEKAGLHCARGIVVSDTMQTYDPRIYAVGECANHRGIAYGLVAPLFDMAKVCANHLALYGIGRYTGSLTSTKLKVTGIDLFSAGNFQGGDGTEDITLSDPIGGVYKRLVIKDDKLIGSVLYGDTVDGAYYFKLLREGRKVSDIRDKLMFGESNLGDAGHQGQNKAAAMSDDMEVCGCNGVCKGSIVKAIKEKGLFTLDDVRKHTKASSSCGSCTGLVEQILMFTAGGDYSASPKVKPMCGCTDHTHAEARQAIRDHELLTIPAVMTIPRMAHPQRLRQLPPGDQLLPAVDLAASRQGRSAITLHQRTRPRQHPEGRHLLRHSADVGRRHHAPIELRRIADVVDKYKIPTVKGHRRPAHRPARREKGRPCPTVWRDLDDALGSRLCQGAAHREDLRRRRMVPLRRAGFDEDGARSGARPVAHVCTAQGQTRRFRLPAQLRRIRHQGRRCDRRRFGVGNLCRGQRRHQDRSRAVPGQGQNRRGSDGIFQRLPAALPRRRLVSGTHGALHQPRRPRLREAAHP